MKHWMAVALIGAMATGLSLANGARTPTFDRTAGLPSGWVADNLVAGQDAISVDRPRGGGPAELVILQRADAPAGKPLSVYQSIDATPWRGRTMIFSFYSKVVLEPEVMRGTKGGKDVEFHVECDGTGAAGEVSVDASWRTREWIEHNFAIRVADDAIRCSLGMASLVRAEVRLSRLHLKDRAAEGEAWIAKRMPNMAIEPRGSSIFTASAAPAVTPPNLEFKQ